MKTDVFIQTYPKLFHMAELGSWPSIQQIGLLSTKATLDRSSLTQPERFALNSCRRAEKETVDIGASRTIVLRDQKPMSEAKLIKCLQNGITPQEWYEFLNSKTFFWATEERLKKLLNAGAYRNEEHDVLTIETAKFVEAYEDRIALCHINSGSTSPYGTARSFDYFKSIAGYATRKSGFVLKEVAEVVVDYSVEDIGSYVIDVKRMKGDVITNAAPY